MLITYCGSLYTRYVKKKVKKKKKKKWPANRSPSSRLAGLRGFYQILQGGFFSYRLVLNSSKAKYYSTIQKTTTSHRTERYSTLSYRILLNQHITMTYRVLLCPTEYHYVLQNITTSYRVLRCPTEHYYYVLQRITTSYRVLL